MQNSHCVLYSLWPLQGIFSTSSAGQCQNKTENKNTERTQNQRLTEGRVGELLWLHASLLVAF